MAVIVVEAEAGGGAKVAQALRALGEDAALSADPAAVARAPRLVVVGGGPLAPARRALGGGLDEALRHAALRGTPLLGIGTGFLVLLEGVDGPDSTKCLGLFAGRVAPLAGGTLPDGRPVRLPHLGPDKVEVRRREGPFVDLAARSVFAFAHDQGVRLSRRNEVAGVCHHGTPLDVAVLAGTLVGLLFHPERSGQSGLALLGAFARWRP